MVRGAEQRRIRTRCLVEAIVQNGAIAWPQGARRASLVHDACSTVHSSPLRSRRSILAAPGASPSTRTLPFASDTLSNSLPVLSMTTTSSPATGVGERRSR